MKNPCGAKCRLKCRERFSEEARQTVYNNFYRTKDADGKWKFIRLYVESKTPLRPKDKEKPLRRIRKYYLPLDGVKKEVCQTMFLNTLVISDFMVGTALNRNVLLLRKEVEKEKR